MNQPTITVNGRPLNPNAVSATVDMRDNEYHQVLKVVANDPFQAAVPCWQASGFKYQQYE